MESAAKADVDMSFGSNEDDQLLMKWNYKADMNMVMDILPKLTTQKQEKIQNLIATCVTLAKEPVDILKEELSEKVIPCLDPFGIDVIFKNIWRFLPVDTLLTCRLVSQFWNVNTIPWIERKMNGSAFIRSKDFPRFCAVFDQSESDLLPVVSLMYFLQELTLEHCSNFFTKYGSCIRNLTVHFTRSGRDASQLLEDLKKLQLILKHTPDLKNLTFHVDFSRKVEFGNQFIFEDQENVNVTLLRVESLELHSHIPLSNSFLDELFKMLPNVKNINLGDFTRRQDWEVFVRAMAKVNVNSFVRPTQYDVPAALWRAMATERSLKLTKLSTLLSIKRNCEEVLEAQRELLRSQSECLEILNLTVECTSNQPQFQFPVMKNLKTATFEYLSNNFYGSYQVQLEPEHLPKLKTLSIDPRTIKNGLFTNSEFTSVQEIKLNKGNLNRYPIVLPKLIATMFPNLKKMTNVETGADLRDMEMIFANLGSIEELEWKILDTDGLMKNFNLALSGIPGSVEDQWAIYQLAERVGYESLSSRIDPPKSLRELKNLKRLMITLDSNQTNKDSFARIDEIAVHLTLLRMSPQLRLTLQGDFLISDELAAKLRAHYRNIYLTPTDHDYEAINENEDFDSDDNFAPGTGIDSDSDSDP